MILALCNTTEATITLYLQTEQTRFKVVYCAVHLKLFQNAHFFSNSYLCYVVRIDA